VSAREIEVVAPPRPPASQPATGTIDFRALFEENLPLVFRTLRRLGVAERDLEDQAHEVFVIVHRHLDRYDPTRPFRTWLLGICYRRAADYRRLARHARETLGEPPEVAESDDTLEDRYVDREAWQRLSRCLDALPDDKRVPLVLHDLEGLTLAEVAEIVGAPLQTVYSRIRAARQAIATCVGVGAAPSGATGRRAR
jgi:RNA polymerase sigma-70 factor (ECF subfamily)